MTVSIFKSLFHQKDFYASASLLTFNNTISFIFYLFHSWAKIQIIYQLATRITRNFFFFTYPIQTIQEQYRNDIGRANDNRKIIV